MARKRWLAVDHQYFIRAPPAKVFRAITDPKWLVRWLADSASISPRRNGDYSVGWKDGPQHSGKILAFVPGKKVTFAWAWEGVPLHGTRFQLSVKPERGGSILKVEHTGIPRSGRWVDLYGGAEWGWTYFAMNLKSVLETGRDLRSPRDG